MKTAIIRMSALTALSVALLGCATAAPDGTTVISGLFGKAAAPKEAAPKESAALAAGAMPVPTDVDSALRQAQAQRRTGDLAGAARTLSQLVLVAPDNSRVLGEYGKTLIAQGRSDDALAFLERAIELGPSDWSFFSAQGVGFDQKGEYQAAQIAYGRALALKPGDPTVLSNDALSHMQAGDLDGAERLLMQAAQNGGEFPRIASNLALVRSLKAARPQQASAPAPQAQAVVPANPPAEPANSVQTPTAAPVVPVAVAESSPAPAPTAPAAQTSAALPAPPEPKVQSLPTELQAAADPKPVQGDSSPIEKLKADPMVTMQAVPKDDKAGAAGAKKRVAKEASQSERAPVPASLALRPALSESNPNQQANARR